MKAKTLMGMIACAGACVSLSAFGNNTNDWFSVGVTGDAIVPVNCATNGAAVSVENNKIVLDNEKESALTFTPVATNMSTGVSVIKATAELTPSDATSLDTTLPEAKVGFAVGIAGNATNYYGFASGEWFKLDGVNPPDSGNTEFQLILDYRSATAQFFVKNSGSYQTLYTNGTTTAFTFDKGSASDISGIDAYGSGSISSLVGEFELAVAVYDGTKYGSIAEAMIDAGSDKDNIKVVDDNGTASSGAAANGLQKWECAALGIAEDKQVGLAKSTKQNAGKITLAVQGVTVGEDLSVKYGISIDNASPTGEFDADNIQIPMGETQGQHTYKIVPNITAE